jgi:mycothiol synthase
MSFVHRSYQKEADYRRMVGLLSEAFAINGMPVYVTASELDYWRCRSLGRNSIRGAQLWMDDRDRLVGFAWLNGNALDMLVLPTRHAAEKEMLAWAEQKVGPGQTLRTWCLTSDTARHTLFSRSGYQRTHEYYTFNQRSLEGLLPEAHVPEGYELRAVHGPQELQARAEVHRAAFESATMTLSRYRSLVKYPSYRCDLDRVVAAPDGKLAAFCTAWLDAPNHHGALEPVGCRPEQRRKGLAKAVVVDALRCLQDSGARTASVFCWWKDEIPARLYQSVGFHELDRVEAWEKAL